MNGFGASVRTAFDLIANADAALVRTVLLSLSVSGSACLIGAAFGLALGAWLAVARLDRKSVV